MSNELAKFQLLLNASANPSKALELRTKRPITEQLVEVSRRTHNDPCHTPDAVNVLLVAPSRLIALCLTLRVSCLLLAPASRPKIIISSQSPSLPRNPASTVFRVNVWVPEPRSAPLTAV